MCSVNETDFEEAKQFMETKPLGMLTGAVCKKCNEEKAEVVLRIRDAYCRNCFIVSVRHKFRATLGKSKIMSIQDQVLVAVSGSQSSFALLHLVKTGISETSPKRLHCRPFVVYIDEGAVLNQTPEERQKNFRSVAELVKTYEIPAFVSTLDKSLVNSSSDQLYSSLNSASYLNINEEQDKDLKALFSQAKSLTAKDDLLQKLRHKLLLMIAEQLNCCKIFVGETGTHLAIKIISNLSLGRGSHLPRDVGFCDASHPCIKVLRPMKDFMKKEVVFYNIFNNVESVHTVSFGTKVNPYSSIQKLTEKFVTDLQSEFPSTVSTVIRTGDKFSSANHSDAPEDSCVLCQAPLDTKSAPSSAIQATEFSRIVSNLGPSGFDDKSMSAQGTNKTMNQQNKNVCCADLSTSHCGCNERVRQTPMQITHQEAEEWLCYGCRLILREMESLDHLPVQVISAIKTNMRMKDMRHEIQDFLL